MLQLRCGFNDISFKDGESVGEFDIHISALANNLRSLAQVVPEKLNQAIISIELFEQRTKPKAEDRRTGKPAMSRRTRAGARVQQPQEAPS